MTKKDWDDFVIAKCWYFNWFVVGHPEESQGRVRDLFYYVTFFKKKKKQIG